MGMQGVQGLQGLQGVQFIRCVGVCLCVCALYIREGQLCSGQLLSKKAYMLHVCVCISVCLSVCLCVCVQWLIAHQKVPVACALL